MAKNIGNHTIILKVLIILAGIMVHVLGAKVIELIQQIKEENFVFNKLKNGNNGEKTKNKLVDGLSQNCRNQKRRSLV
ncbi:MAG: hypothetical protein RLZZ196_2073 [Bacteroidota bacterium]|jgi:hypothetical protein